MGREQDEVEGVVEAEMVLPDVRKAVQGWEWFQVPHNVRGNLLFNMIFFEPVFTYRVQF